MTLAGEIVLSVLVCITALLFASVGNAGAAGYLAAMGLVGVAPDVMRPTALVLNVVVSLVSAVLFLRVDRLPFRLIVPFLVGSVPAAFLGGSIVLPGHAYKLLIAALLLFVAWRLLKQPAATAPDECRPPHPAWMVVVGAGIGIVSGLTGVGGGIFLNPLLVLANWTDPRRAAGITAAFNFANSISGVLGAKEALRHVAPCLPALAVAAALGGVVGATLGARHLSRVALRRVLAVVLVVVAVRLIVVG